MRNHFKPNLKLFLLIFVLFLFSAPINTVLAQVYKMELADPAQEIKVDDTFNVKVLINTEGIEAVNGDVLLIFDPLKLSVVTAASDNFFTYNFSTLISGADNKYLASSWEESIAHAKRSSSDTPFYTLSVKAVGSGQTSLSFDCTNGSEADTNINQSSDSSDVVKCPLSPLDLNIGGQTGPTNTPGPTSPTEPEPTAEPTATSTPSPTKVPPTATPIPPTRTPIPTVAISELPRAGIISDTLGLLGIGSVLTVLGLLFML